MNFLRAGFIALLAIALGFGLAYQADAQTTTGKIAGRITDAGGESLPGANVVLVGTRMGATADVNGDYFIIQVSPGVYEVQASLVGYHTVSKTDVVVSIDRTSPVNFSLTESTVELSEITVVAERPPVELEVSYAQTIMKASEVREAPTGPRLRDAFATQVGVDSDDWGLTIRGASEEEILYTMDGVGMKDNRNNRPYSSFSKTNLAEVQILTGGFSAEYGDARSGVVNIVTREPRQFTISADARYNPAGRKHFGPDVYSSDNWWDIGRFESDGATADRNGDGVPDFKGWTQEFSDRGGPAGEWTAGIYDLPITTVAQAKGIWAWQHRNFELEGNNGFNANAADRESDYHYDVTVGTPVISDKLSVMLTNQRERTAYTYDLSKTSYRDNLAQAKLTFTPTATTKLSLGYLRGWADGTKTGDFTGTFVRSQVEASRRFDDVQMFAPGSQANQETIDRNYYTLNWSHTLSPKTFYNITARYGRTDWEATWQKPQAVGIPAAAVYPDGRVEEITESGVASAQSAGAVILDEAPVGWNYANRRVDILGIYRLRGGGGASRSADWSYIKETDLTFDITSQMTPHHQVKAGIQAHTFFLREYRGYTSTLPDRPEGWENDNPADIVATQTANLHNYWVKTPWYGGFFVQDRMEYRQIVVNAGLRLDFHRPDKWFDLVGQPHAEYLGSNAELLYENRRSVRAPTKWAWSPRFGVSHPTTATSKLFFNYGHFYQVPTTVELYRAQSGAGEPLENFGNTWVEMPQTIAYELGFEKSFEGKYLASGTVYFKDIDKELEPSTSYYPENSTGRRTRWTTQGRIKDVRGYELAFKKSRGQFLTGFISYDYRQERSKRIGWDRIYDQNTVSTPSRLIIEGSANAANPQFKPRPIWKLGLNFRTPLDYGAEQRMLKGGWEANLFFRREGGWWMNHNPTNDSALQNVLNVQWTDSNMTDLRISKAFDTRGAPLLYLEIHNIFNFKNFNNLRDYDGEVWDYPGTNDDAKADAYMERLGWTVDASGKLQEGSRPGSDVDLDNFPETRRPYIVYLDRRDITFGLRFSF